MLRTASSRWIGALLTLMACGQSTEPAGPPVNEDGWWERGVTVPAAAPVIPEATPTLSPKPAPHRDPARMHEEAPSPDSVDEGGVGHIISGGRGASLGGAGLGARSSVVAGGGVGEDLGIKGLGDGRSGYGAPARMRPPTPAAQASPLRAGRTDDHQDWGAFTSWLQRWPEPGNLTAGYQVMNLDQRVWVTVDDKNGGPVPGAVVSLHRGEQLLYSAATHGDGRTVVFPGLVSGQADRVSVTWRDRTSFTAWSGADTRLTLPQEAGLSGAVPIDVAFILDTTGSMGDEIERIRATLRQVVERLGQGERPISLRLGAVLYRDHGDAYLTRGYPLTADVERFRTALDDVAADGGGDTPEALNAGLADAVHQLPWRAEAAKVAFLIADAGPHMDRTGEVPYGTTSLDALGRGVRVHTVAASGLPESGTLVFRQIAAVTRGQFVFIEYGGSVAATAASHGVANPGQVASNNLDQILYDRIKAEVDGWGVR
jgi:hypothetical protein